MGSQVFTVEAMAACAERGHTWRTVRTWYTVAHQECSRCGQTWFGVDVPPATATAVDRPSRAAAEPRPPRDAAATPPAPKVKRASPTGVAWGATAAQRRVRDEDIARRVAAGEPRKAIADHYGLNPSRIAQIMHAMGREIPPKQSPFTERDAEIRRRRAANEPAEAVAAAFGLSVARVYQIAPAHPSENPQQ